MRGGAFPAVMDRRHQERSGQSQSMRGIRQSVPSKPRRLSLICGPNGPEFLRAVHLLNPTQ